MLPAASEGAFPGGRLETCQNMLLETENYFLEAHVFSTDVLFVTFESATIPGDRADKYRQGWGVSSFRKRGISVLAIKPKAKDWYMHPDLGPTFAALRPWLATFGRVIAYGGSMGGFGALTYADAMGATDVIAINPQSTMLPDLVPWETRFRAPLDLFTGPYADANGNFAGAARVLILVDRYYGNDWGHVARLEGARFRVLNVPFLQHGLPGALARIGVLGWMIEAIVDGSFTEAEFYRRLRRRRELRRYARGLRQITRHKPQLNFLVQILLGDGRRGDQAEDADRGDDELDGYFEES